MRIALYRPVGPESDPYPFGDNHVAQLMTDALRLAGHDVDLVPEGLESGAAVEGKQGVADLALSGRPDVWISALIDGRAGDRIGRTASAALDIPYILLQPRMDGVSGSAAVGSGIPLQANAIFAISDACAAKIAAQLPDHADRVIALSPFIDFDAVEPAIKRRQTDRARLALKYQFPTDVPWLIAAGPMATGADLESFRLLARAMAPLSTVTWRLIVAGSGGRQAEVEAILRVPMHHQRLLTVDTQAELLALLACGDLFIWPSNGETLPLPAIAAQALGLPVVAGNTAIMQEIVANGRTGMLVKPDNVASLTNAVSFLLRHPEFRRTYAEQGPNWVARYFDLRTVVSQLDAALHRVVRRTSPNDAAWPVRSVD